MVPFLTADYEEFFRKPGFSSNTLVSSEGVAQLNINNDIMDDDHWEPPSEGMVKLLEARRERSDRISKLMGDYLLKGYKMLGSTCPECDTILMETKQGVKYCIACSELDSDTDKDDPVTSQTAALALAREQSMRGEVAPRCEAAQLPLVSHPHLPLAEGALPKLEVQQLHRIPVGLNQTANASSSGTVGGRADRYIRDLLDKLDWASAELRATQSVDYSIQLCSLVKGCADAISSVRAALDSLP